jgi:hypothetical protein
MVAGSAGKGWDRHWIRKTDSGRDGIFLFAFGFFLGWVGWVFWVGLIFFLAVFFVRFLFLCAAGLETLDWIGSDGGFWVGILGVFYCGDGDGRPAGWSSCLVFTDISTILRLLLSLPFIAPP